MRPSIPVSFQRFIDNTHQSRHAVAALVVVERRHESVAELDEHRDVRHGADAPARHGRHPSAGRLGQVLQVAQRPRLVGARGGHVRERHDGHAHLLPGGQRERALRLVRARRAARDQDDDVTGARGPASFQHLA